MQVIEFENFTYLYKQKKNKKDKLQSEYVTAIDNISFSVESGEFVVLVGASGCGKTTLLKSCLGLPGFFKGSLKIEGKSIEDFDLKNGSYAFVRQEIALYPNLTIYENIAFPLRVIHTPVSQIDERVKEMAKLVDMEIFLSRKPHQLSGGQQQRVAIARALIKNPRIIYFDEPFSSVDPQLRVALRQLVKKLHQQMNLTILFATHDLSEAFMLADKIIVMDKGKIIEMGTPTELRENGQSELIKGFFKK